MRVTQEKLLTMMSDDERKVEQYKSFQIYMVALACSQIITLILGVGDTYCEKYRIKNYYWVGPLRWAIVSTIMLLGHKTQKTIFLRIGFHFQFITQILWIYNFFKSRFLNEFAEIIILSQPKIMCLFGMLFMPFCHLELSLIHI